MADDNTEINLEPLVAAIVADAGGELRVNVETFNGLSDDLVLAMDLDGQVGQVVIRLLRKDQISGLD